MSQIETSTDPTPKERKALAIALCALGGVVALLILFKPESLLFVACVSAIAWCASMLFNHDEPRGRQWKGFFVPLIAGSVYAATLYLESPAMVAVVAAAVLLVLGILVWFLESFGNRLHRTWTLLFMPLAWSVSTLLLVLVYYLVLSPIGLVLRLFGRDPMHRKLDRDATSYWVKRDQAVDPDRYFRQF
jgi:hypothetical protein